ncbi:proteasome assembly chaperone 3-like [Argonauta hians]
MATPTLVSGACPQAFPVKSKQASAEINGHQTEVTCCSFEDYIFLIVTQYMKIGTLVRLSPENVIDSQRNPFISSKVILGKDEPMTHVLAKNIQLGMATSKPVLLSLAMKDTSRETLTEVVKLVQQCNVWT